MAGDGYSDQSCRRERRTLPASLHEVKAEHLLASLHTLRPRTCPTYRDAAADMICSRRPVASANTSDQGRCCRYRNVMLGYQGDGPDSGQIWEDLSSRICTVGASSIPAMSIVVLLIDTTASSAAI